MRHKVVVIHALRPTSRQTTIDHLLSFREHLPNADVQYLHFQQPLPDECRDVEPDLVVINYDFLNYRFSPLWPFMKRRHKQLADRAKKVVAIAQDDFWANKLLDDWCMDWDVDRILTPIDTDREVLYPRSIRSKEFRTGLTGYVKSGPPPVTAALRDRPIDLGQRVRDMPPHLGRLAQAKAVQAVTMADAARAAGFVVDVSTRVEDSFLGTAWFEFLASCKFTVGMKGGASLHDPRGLIHTKVESYRGRRPHATFDEIEAKCFPGKDLKHEFTAISPRLFESALAGTCQILQREDYLGVLEPWCDYLPLEKDFTNIHQVTAAMRDLEQCQEIVENAKTALVDSKLFDYSHLVHTTTDGLLGQPSISDDAWMSLAAYLRRSADVFASAGPELFDVALHLINETIVARVKKTDAVVARRVLELVETSAMSQWYCEIAELVSTDSLAKRAPWTWRPVVVGDER